MKIIMMMAGIVSLFLSMTACGNEAGSRQSIPEASAVNTLEYENEAQHSDKQSEHLPEAASQEETLIIQAGEHLLTATLAQNSSAEALAEMLSEGPVTINMSDYADMEKVGALPENLPRNDEQINTEAGDLILYQGNSFVIYYDTNSWSLTRLGKINNVTPQELKNILGEGSVEVVLSLDLK